MSNNRRIMRNLAVRHPTKQFWQTGLLLLALLALLTGLHYRYAVEPLDFANKDFMSLWTGGKAVLLGLNPYNPEVWQSLRAANGSQWMPDARAPFPLWTFLLMTPFALLPLPWAAALWMAVSEALLGVTLYGVIVLLKAYRPLPIEVGLLAIGAYASIITILVLINGQMTLFLLALLVLFLWLLKTKRLFWAGFALAFTALKPNPFILFIPLIGLWLLWSRQWRVIIGGAAGGFALLASSWLAQPGWVSGWMHARGKTSVVTITPTVWGLSAEIAGNWWLPVGMLLTVLITVWVAYLIFSQPRLPAEAVVSLAMAASLLTTPYAWAYEQALLFLPWAWLFAVWRNRRAAQGVWTLLALVVPWGLFLIAAARSNDSLGFISPLLALGGLWWAQSRPN